MTTREDMTAAVGLVRTAAREDRVAAIRFALAVALGRIPGPEPDPDEQEAS